MEIFGIPHQAFLGQLMLGLVNGAFYAMLSLGLAVIFGLLGVVNFAHGALYMLGAFAAWIMLDKLGISYWFALVLAPLVVGAFGVVIERLFLKHLYKLDPLYGLLLTFGLALIVEGVFRELYGASGQSYPVPELLSGATNLGFMVLPNYRAWVVLVSLVVCLGTWFLIERTSLGANLRAGTGPDLRHQRAHDGHADLWRRRCTGSPGRRAGCTDYSGQSPDGIESHHRGVCRGGDRRHGLDSGLGSDRFGTGLD
jgi:branched-chain amino acid transport system permease protein